VRKGELTGLPIDDQQLSLSLMALVLPYVSSPQEVFAEVYRVTKPGGKLVLLDMVPHDRAEYREQLGHSWQGFSEKQITEWLDACGWTELRFQQIPPDPEAKGTGLFLATAKR
jgi:ubiquinone/menaquinone biosynthesis C-methylase UbiE